MDRRSYLSVVGGVGVPLLAGCLGNADEIEDLEEEIEDLEDEHEDEIEDLEEEISELEQQEESLQSEIEDLEAREGVLENEIEGLEEDSEDYDELVRERIKLLYELATEYHTLAEEEYNSAYSLVENGNWVAASTDFGMAFRSYDVVTEYTFQASILAGDEGYSDAEELATESNNHSSNMADACDYYVTGTESFATGDDDSGWQNIDQGDSYYEEAQQFDFHRLREFEPTL